MPRGRPSRNSKSKVVEESASDSAPEEYEVERVESHKIERKGKKSELKYLVKWKNYDASENTWEPVSAVENAHQLVDEYWATLGGEKQREEVLKQLKGGKAPAAAPAKKTAVEEDKPAESKKRRASSRSTAPATSTTTTAPKRKRARAASTEAPDAEEDNSKVKETLYESEDEFDVSDSEVENEDFRINKPWTNVYKVQYVRRDEVDNQLYAIVRWKDAKLAKYKTSTVARKAPLKLIEFYENRLSFQED